MDMETRTVALVFITVFFVGTLIGSLLPEWGNIAVRILHLTGDKAHIFNGVFLIGGILGIGMALHLGYRNSG